MSIFKRPQGLGTYLVILLLVYLAVTLIRIGLRAQVINPNPQALYASSAFSSHYKDIYENPMTPSFGNAAGDVTVVQYFDYQCNYSKADEENVERLLEEDKHVRFIFKDFPKLGPYSVVLARAAMASLRQGPDKYLKLHEALLSNHAAVSNDDALYAVASSVGINVGQLKEDMNDPAIARQIQDGFAIGKSIGVTIVPTFVRGGYLVPGFQDYESLKQMVAYIRSTNGMH